MDRLRLRQLLSSSRRVQSSCTARQPLVRDLGRRSSGSGLKQLGTGAQPERALVGATHQFEEGGDLVLRARVLTVVRDQVLSRVDAVHILLVVQHPCVAAQL